MNKVLPIVLLAALPLSAHAQDGQTPTLPRGSAPVTFKQPLNPSWWVQISLGYNYAFFSDLNQGSMNMANYTQALNAMSSAITNASSIQTGNSGIQETVELGFQLDKESALCLKAENDLSQSIGWLRTEGVTVAESFKVDPLLWGASLNFEHSLFRSKWGRTFFTVGGGWYFADFNATDYDANTLQTTTAAFTGNTFGGTLGLGQQIELGGAFDLEFSIEGRWLAFNSLSSASTPGPNFAPGPYSLVIVKSENFGSGFSSNTDYLLWTSQQFISGHPDDYRLAVADYSGISGVFSLRYSF